MLYDVTIYGLSCNPDDTGTVVTNLISTLGCDSTITHITNLDSGGGVFIVDTISAGEEYILPDGTIVTEAGDYSVVLMLDNGCDSTINILLLDDTGIDLGIPTVFTPNGDGTNDIFLSFIHI